MKTVLLLLINMKKKICISNNLIFLSHHQIKIEKYLDININNVY
jgi:hypothetical protein